MSESFEPAVKPGVFVPQLFYDLIGRVIPGILLMLIAAVLFVEPATLMQATVGVTGMTAGGATALMALTLLVAYSIGILLGHLAQVLYRQEWKDDLEETQAAEPAAEVRKQDVPFVYDAIQHHLPPEGARLAKLSAERSLARVLCAGTLLLTAGAICTHFVGGPPRQIALPILLLITTALLSYALHLHLRRRSWHLLVNGWYIIRHNCTQKSGGPSAAATTGRPPPSKQDQPVRGA